MTSEVETFVENPSDDLLDALTREQLDQVVTHYGIEVSKNDKRSKVSLKKSLRAGLVLKGLLNKDTEELTPSRSKKTPSTSPVLSPAPGGSLTYQQQLKLLRLQADRDVEMAKLASERERKQAERDVEMAKLDCERKQADRDVELAKLEFEMKRLELIAAGKLRPDNSVEAPPPRFQSKT